MRVPMNSPAAAGTSMDVGYLIGKAAREYPQRTAVITPGEGSLTFAEINERSQHLSAGLLSLGLKKGDRVAVLLPNSQEYLEAYLGLARAGLVRVTLNTRLSPREHAFMLGDSGSRALIIAREFLEGLAGAARELKDLSWTIVVGDPGRECLGYEKLLADSSPLDSDPEVGPEAVFRLHYTSGTTGRPKGAIQTHASRVVTTFNTLLDVVNFNQDDRVLHVAPLTHASGNLFLPSFIRGAANVPLRRYDSALFCQTVEREGITAVFLAPTMLLRLLTFPDLGKYHLPTLHTIIYGGAPMPVEPLKEALRTFGQRLVQIYGLAEATWADTVLRKEDHDPNDGVKLGSIGRELRNVRLRLVNDAGKDITAGETGELIIQGAHVMREYWNQPEATAEVLRDGWFHTGDLARMDGRGYITLVDRKGEMIISGGLNIYPKEVEDTLYRHPAVLEAAVFAVPDPEWGEAVQAVVVLKEGWVLSEEEIIRHCKENLAGYKKPRSVEFFNEPLPKNSAGKILRRALREKYWIGYDRRVH